MRKPPATKPEPRTKTLPEAMRGAWYQGPDVVTMFRVVGRELTFELPRTKKRMKLGTAAEGDLVIADEFVSRSHCVIERRGSVTHITDSGSRNGTFFRGRREREFDVQPGETFFVAGIEVLAMNDAMREQYPMVAELVGDENEHASGQADAPSPTKLVVLATAGASLLITGERGCGQEQLADAVHAMSLRRHREIVHLPHVPGDRPGQRAIIDRAARSTLVITIGNDMKTLDPTFASMLFSSSYSIRVVAIAPIAKRAAAVLGEEHVALMERVWLRPLALRQGAILRLLDARFARRATALRTSQLTESNQVALSAYEWPGNLPELELAAERLITIATTRSQADAAEALSMTERGLRYWRKQLSLELPLLAYP